MNYLFNPGCIWDPRMQVNLENLPYDNYHKGIQNNQLTIYSIMVD